MKPIATLVLILAVPTFWLAAMTQSDEYQTRYATLPADQAEQMFAELLKQDRKNPELQHYYGRSLFDQGRVKDALKPLERAVELNPDHAGYHYHYALALIERLDSVGVLRQPLIARKAKAMLDRALEIDASHLGARTARFRYLLNAPGIAGGSIDQARQDAEALSAFAPARSQLLMARWHQSQGDTEAAIQAYDQAVALQPDDPELHFQRVIYRVDQGEADGAFAALNEAFATLESSLAASESADSDLHTLHMQLRYQLGKAAAKWGRELEPAETALRAYLAADIPADAPPRAWAWYRLGQILQHADRPAAAEQAFTEAMNAQPEPELRALLAQRLDNKDSGNGS